MRELENAVVRLLKARPFYGYLLLGLRRRQGQGPAPAGVTLCNGTPVLQYCPPVFAALTPGEQQGVLEHLIKHLLHRHILRRKERNAHSWDIACDLAINPGIAELPSGAPMPGRFRLPEGLAAEEYYRHICTPFDTGNLEGQGLGNASRDRGEHLAEGSTAEEISPLDDHHIWSESDSTPSTLADEVVRGMVRQAWSNCRGEVPGELRSLVDGWLAPSPIPWKQVLRQFIATAGRIGRCSTWKREHRRFAHQSPGVRKRRRLNLLVGVDVSDSTDQGPLREAFARELLQIARGAESRITVLYAGSRIQRIESFQGSAFVAQAYHGGGFTDLRPLFDYARTLHPRPAAVIYLTDGFGPAPETMEWPTLWVLTPEGKKPAPWGVELRLTP